MFIGTEVKVRSLRKVLFSPLSLFQYYGLYISLATPPTPFLLILFPISLQTDLILFPTN